jgi:hypothetical protein
MSKRKRIPDLLVEQLRLGELPESQARALARDPDVQARLADLEASDLEILRAYPPQVMARQIRRRAERGTGVIVPTEGRETAGAGAEAVQKPKASAKQSREAALQDARLPPQPGTAKGGAEAARPEPRPARPRWTLPRLVPAIGLATLLVIGGISLAVIAPRADRSEPEAEITRVKGARAHLVIHRRTAAAAEEAAGAEALSDGAAVRPGDVLQIGYVAGAVGGAVHGAIFSIDGRGVLTLHFPASAAAPTRLEGAGAVLLDYAYRLDDAPEFERFFLVTADRPFPVEAALQAGRALAARPLQARQGSLALPEGLAQWSIVLLKKQKG